MMLDIITIQLIFLANSTLTVVVLLFIWRKNRFRYAGIGAWCLAYALQVLGMLLLLGRGRLPDFITILVAHTVTGAGMFLLYAGLARFVGQRPRLAPNLVVLAIQAVILVGFTYLWPNSGYRTLLASGTLMIFAAQAGHLLLRETALPLRPITRTIGIIFLLYVFILAARVVLAGWDPPQSGSPYPMVQTFLIFILQLLHLGTTFALVEMIAHRLHREALAHQTGLTEANQQLQARMGEIEQLQDDLREQLLHDPLTGLYNRRYLSENLDREISRAGLNHQPLSIIISDIDHFKRINDTHGHKVGDEFLVKIAALFKSQARGSDFVCRYGGEEFLLILPTADADTARQRAEEIRRRCAETTLAYAGQSLRVSLSFGVAAYPTHGQSADEITIKADQALYHSKRTGRNRVTVWRHPMR
jgi:diguanylate cyclase (GGDEF)-like protein